MTKQVFNITEADLNEREEFRCCECGDILEDDDIVFCCKSCWNKEAKHCGGSK